MTPLDTSEHTAFVLQLVAERFSAFAAVGGPLSVGQVEFEARPGSLYLTQTRTWLFFGKDPNNDHTLTHQQVSTVASPAEIARRLLNSMTATIAAFQEHLNLIETKADDLTTLLGFYLSDSTATVVDAIALRRYSAEGDLWDHDGGD